MFKHIVLAAVVLATLFSGAVSANAQGWQRGGWHGRWGGPVIVMAPPIYAEPCRRMWDGYMWRSNCYGYAPPMAYMPRPPMPYGGQYNNYGQRPPMNPPPLPNVCTVLAGNAVAGNGQPICRH